MLNVIVKKDQASPLARQEVLALAWDMPFVGTEVGIWVEGS